MKGCSRKPEQSFRNHFGQHTFSQIALEVVHVLYVLSSSSAQCWNVETQDLYQPLSRQIPSPACGDEECSNLVKSHYTRTVVSGDPHILTRRVRCCAVEEATHHQNLCRRGVRTEANNMYAKLNIHRNHPTTSADGVPLISVRILVFPPHTIPPGRTS